ncbi:MAG: phosphate ABC transporter permease PstA [Syntrophobacteraceae bacterium]
MNENLALDSLKMKVDVAKPMTKVGRSTREMHSDLSARGEPFLWGFGGALALGLIMVVGFLVLIVANGLTTFYPKPLWVVTLKDGSKVAGEPTRTELYKLPAGVAREGAPEAGGKESDIPAGFARRTLYRIGNFDLYNEDFKWVNNDDVAVKEIPNDIYLFERLEWGPFIGFIRALDLEAEHIPFSIEVSDRLSENVREATDRLKRIKRLEREEIGAINREMDGERLALKRVALDHGEHSDAYRLATERFTEQKNKLQGQYDLLIEEARAVKAEDARYTITLADVHGREKVLPLSQIVRFLAPNDLSLPEKLGVFVSRWGEFLTAEPREANTEGGVMPAIFGTFVMTVLMAVAVAPFGIMAALYLREYAKQGRLVSIVRICVNNLAGVPSIVYGVFGLGFFAYICGGAIDRIFFPERLPNPTFGTGGVLWSSLTLALLTVPVVIVATEEALAAVPQSMREGSLACGASKWQTIRYIVLPRAMPGIMTGLILAMARGAGEVAPLMLVGVVKLAPELPIDLVFPYVHLERSFMHLGFHIFDVGFQSRNSEAGKPMVFVTTFLLITLVGIMNATAIYVRNRLKKRFITGHF